jgi:hypothetical protein
MKFEITLQAKFWGMNPLITMKVDNIVATKVQDFTDGKEKVIKFETDVGNGHHQLVIQRQNEIIDDTIVEDGLIIKDSTVEIMEVLIDRIVVGRMGKYPFLLDKANYFPEYPEPWYSEQKEKGETPPVSYKHCQTLHHNGEWKLDFESPVHYWFFEYYSGKRKFS